VGVLVCGGCGVDGVQSVSMGECVHCACLSVFTSVYVYT
jgi:hypothetical protein